jgi:hypothetical protein
MKPNTLEGRYMDVIRFIRAHYRYECDVFLDDVEGRFAVKAAQRWHKYDPARAGAFTFLCWLARSAYYDADQHRKRGVDVMNGYATARREITDLSTYEALTHEEDPRV